MRKKCKRLYIYIYIIGLCFAWSIIAGSGAFAIEDDTSSTIPSVPTLRIDLNGVTLDYINNHGKEAKYGGNTVTLTTSDGQSVFNDVEIKGRGNSTWTMYPKRPYQIKLNSKESLLGLGKAKKYILLADYRDRSHLRNELAFYCAGLLGEKYAPKGQWVDFYNGDKYQGIYLLTTKNEVGSKRIDLKDANGVVMELDNIYSPDDEFFVSGNGDRFVLKDIDDENNAKTGVGIFKTAYNKFEKALNNKNWADVESLVDIESFAQYYLMSELSGNPDAYQTSFYFYKDGPNDKIHAGPIWDYDWAFNNNAFWHYYIPSYTSVRSALKYPKHSDVFLRLAEFPEFQSAVSNLFITRLSGQKDTIISHIDSSAAYIRDSANADRALWNRESFDEAVSSLRAWMIKRLDYMQLLYGQSYKLQDGVYNISGLGNNLLVQKNSDGSYRITQLGTGKALDIVGGGTEIGAVAQWYAWNGSVAQRWFFSKDADGKYYIFSKIDGLVLDVNKKRIVELSAGSSSQALTIESVQSPFAELDEDDEFLIVSAIKGRLVLDIVGGSKNSGANLQVYGQNNTSAQKFRFRKHSDGTYEIVNIGSGKALDVYGGSFDNGANVWQYSRNSSDAQRWLPLKNSDGTITFINNGSKKALDVYGGSSKNGTNVHQYAMNGTKAQKWTIVSSSTKKMAEKNVDTLEDGDYVIRSSINQNYVLDVYGGQKGSAVNIQLYKYNGTNAQKWRVSHDSDGYVVIENVGSNKPMDVAGAGTASGTNIQQYAANGTKAQKWVATADSKGRITLVSALAVDRVLDVSGGTMRSGENIQIYVSNGTSAQKWIFEKINKEDDNSEEQNNDENPKQ